MLLTNLSWGSNDFDGEREGNNPLKRKFSTSESLQKRQKVEVKKPDLSCKTHFTDILFKFSSDPSDVEKKTNSTKFFDTLKRNFRGKKVDLTTDMKIHLCLEVTLNGGKPKQNVPLMPTTFPELLVSNIFDPLLNKTIITFDEAEDWDDIEELKIYVYNFIQNLSLTNRDIIEGLISDYYTDVDIITQALLRLFNSNREKPSFLRVFTTLKKVSFRHFQYPIFQGFFLNSVEEIEMEDVGYGDEFKIAPYRQLPNLKKLSIKMPWGKIPLKIDGNNLKNLRELSISDPFLYDENDRDSQLDNNQLDKTKYLRLTGEFPKLEILTLNDVSLENLQELILTKATPNLKTLNMTSIW